MTETVAYLQAEAECQLAAYPPAGGVAAHPQVPLPLRLPHPPLGGPLRRLGGLPGGLHPLRLQAADLVRRSRTGSGRRCRWMSGMLPDLVPPTQPCWGRSPRRPAEATGIPGGTAASSPLPPTRRVRCWAPGLSGASTSPASPTAPPPRSTPPAAATSRSSRSSPLYPSAVPTAYNLEIQIYRGYWMVSWFRQRVRPAASSSAPRSWAIAPEELVR
jgi:hypothetical protein